MNPIFTYVAHLVFEFYFPVGVWVSDTHSLELLMDLWGCVVWCLVAYKMHRQAFYISV